jgi:hypothetical protein
VFTFLCHVVYNDSKNRRDYKDIKNEQGFLGVRRGQQVVREFRLVLELQVHNCEKCVFKFAWKYNRGHPKVNDSLRKFSYFSLD